MQLNRVDEHGLIFVEGVPDEVFLTGEHDVNRLIEGCFSEGAVAALLYNRNLPPAFFDLSSGEAGAILQKTRTYQIRLAVICPPGSVLYSSRFGEMQADEQHGAHFGVFETRDAAIDWIRRYSEQ